MADAQTQFSGTRPVAPQHAFDVARLAAFMRQHVQGFEGELAVEQFKGGQSNPTFLLTAGRQRYVLRRKPPGTLLPSAHAVEREYRVIKALAATEVPVARAGTLAKKFARYYRVDLDRRRGPGLDCRAGCIGPGLGCGCLE